MLDPYSTDVVWIVVFGYIVAFILAFGLGANDVSNSFGTSVGSKVLTIKQACSIATVAEIAGAILIGKYRVHFLSVSDYVVQSDINKTYPPYCDYIF